MPCRSNCRYDLEDSAILELLKREAVLTEAKVILSDWSIKNVNEDGRKMTFQMQQVRFQLTLTASLVSPHSASCTAENSEIVKQFSTERWSFRQNVFSACKQNLGRLIFKAVASVARPYRPCHSVKNLQLHILDTLYDPVSIFRQVSLMTNLMGNDLEYRERACDRRERLIHNNPVVERYWAKVDEADHKFEEEQKRYTFG